jgi:hypothetical protein
MPRQQEAPDSEASTRVGDGCRPSDNSVKRATSCSIVWLPWTLKPVVPNYSCAADFGATLARSHSLAMP